MNQMNIRKTKMLSVIILALAFVFALSALGIVAKSGRQPAYAEGETLVDSLELTINEQTGRASAKSDAYSLTSSAFQANKVSAANGVGNYSVNFRSSTYLFSDSLTLTVNGKAHTDFEIHTSKQAILVYYTASTNYVELYDGANKITSTIDFGTVDKSQLASATKTIKIKNIGSAPTLQMALSLASSSGDTGGTGGTEDAGGAGSSSSGVGFLPSTSSLASVAANGETTFTLSAISSLSAGTYTNTINIKSTGQNAFNCYPIDVTYTVTLTVTESYKLAVYENSTAVSDGQEFDFGTVDIDNIGTITKTFTFKNEGGEVITALELEAPTENPLFDLDKFAIESLAVNESVTVTVTINANAQAGTYQYVPLQWKNGEETVSGYVVLKITITQKDPYVLEAYNGETKLLPSQTYNFGQIEEGGTPPDAKSFRIVNAGNNATGDLTVYLDYTSGSNAYTCVSTIPSIAKGGEYSLSIQPKSGLSVGTYTATVNVYNDNLSAGFQINFVVHGITEISSVTVPAGFIVAPVTDATITSKNTSGTGYMLMVTYQEKSGETWIDTTSATFMAGKIYRLRAVATITNANDYIFSDGVTLTLGTEEAEDVTCEQNGKSQNIMVKGYKTYTALPAAEYSLEMVCSSPNYSDSVYTMTVEDEYAGTEPILFTFNNLGTQPTGDLDVSFVLYNTSTPGEYFEHDPIIYSIDSGESYYFEVKPVLGLEPNPLDYYWETVTISNTHFSFTFDIKLRVEKQEYKMVAEYIHVDLIASTNDTEEVTYKITNGETATYSFDHLYAVADRPYEKLKVGYTDTDANRFSQQIKIVNSGNNALTNIAVMHGGTGDEYFTFTTSSLNTTVAASNYQKKQTYFTIVPKVGAPAGTHKTTVVITADNVDPIIITFSFTVNIEVDSVVISGLTVPEGYDAASRDLVVETEGVYIRILGWSKINSGSVWLGKYNNIFRAGDQYKLNLHLNTKTGYVFKNYSTDTSWAGSKIAFNFTLSFDGIDFATEISAGNLVSQNLSGETYSADSCYYTATFLAKEPTVKGTAKIDIYDYDTEYVLNANYGVEGLDLASNLRFMWYKDGVALNGEFAYDNSYYALTKSTVTADATYYYEIQHASRTGTLRSESIVIGPTTRLKPTGTVVSVASPSTCVAKGTVTWYRDGLEYRIANSYDDISDTFTDWVVASVEEVSAGGTGGTTTGGGDGGSGGSSVSYQGTLSNVVGGTILWFRYKQTETLSASEIGIFTVEKGSHTLEHHDAVVPEPDQICLVNSVQEYNYCSVCEKYFDVNGNEFETVDYVTTYATGHKDADGDFVCDYCGVSLMERYFFRVETAEDITLGAKYIIVNENGQVMQMLPSVSTNGGKYVGALTVSRIQADIDADRYAADDIDQLDAFVFQIGTIPSKSTATKTCYSFHRGDACIDFSNGLVLSPKSWDNKTGFSITEKENGTFTIATWTGNVELTQGTLKKDGSTVFALSYDNKLLSLGNALRLYKVVSATKTLDGDKCEINEKKTVSDYSEMDGTEGAKSSVLGVLDALDEEYIQLFAKKKELSGDNLQIDIESTVEVTEKTENEITLDVHPTISCGEEWEIIPDKNLNGREMTLALYAGTSVPDTVTHRLTTGGEEIIYRDNGGDETKKTFTYETDESGNVFVTFTVTEFSTFVLTSSPSTPSADTAYGTVEIAGTATVGQTLTAELKDSNIDTKNATFVWKRDGVTISGATESSYTLTDADKGAKITVTVSDSTLTGSLTSAETEEVTENTGSGEGGKEAITGTIRFEGTAQVGEFLYFAVEEGNVDEATHVYTWYRGTTVISGATDYYYALTEADKGYKIHVTIADGIHEGTLTSEESAEVTEASGGEGGGTTGGGEEKERLTGTVEIGGTAKVGETLTVEVKDSNIDRTAVYTWFRDGAAIERVTGETYTLTEEDIGTKISVSVSDTTHEGTLTSAETEEVISNIRSAPTARKTDCTNCQNNDGTITGVDTTMEYSTDGRTWNSISETSITGLTNGTYYVRYAATLEEEASESQELTIAGGDHTYGTWQDEVPSDCKTQGTKAHKTCSACRKNFDRDGNEIDDITLPLASHSFNDWETTTPATCTENGLEERTCKVCGEKESNVLTALGHDYQFSKIEWTGYTAKAIFVCSHDDSHVQSYDCEVENEITTVANCVTKGVKTYTATYDEHTDTKTEDLGLDENNHDIEHFEAQAATCTEDGWQAYDACKRCDYSTKVSIPALNHAWGEITYTWSEDYSTCTAKRICGNDANHIEEETVTASKNVTQAQTCTDKEIATFTATFTNGVFSAQTKADIETKQALEHDYQFSKIEWTGYTAKAIFVCSHDDSHTQEYDCTISDEITTVANCVTKGVRTYTATYGEHTDTKTEDLGLDENNHDIEHFEAQAATCTEDGWNAYDACKRCGYSTKVSIPALNHAWGEITYTWSEDYSTCTAKRICGNDANHIEEETATASKNVTQAQTCTDKEIATFTATFTNGAFSAQTKADIETKQALEHDYQFSKIEWTGYTAKAVFVCSHDESHTQEYDCTISDEITTVANCVTKGVRTYTATYGEHTDTKTEDLGLDENNHDIEHFEAQAATCTEDGWQAYDACKRCDYSTKVSIPALNHAWGEVTYTWSEDYSTCTAKRICGNDANHIEEETVNSTYSVDTPATCIAHEKGHYNATFVHASFVAQTKETEKDTFGEHSYGEWTVLEEADCEHDGQRERVCSVCAHKETETVTATGHTFGEWEVTKEATFTEAGSKHRVCSVCGEEETEEIAKIDAIPYFNDTVDGIDMNATFDVMYEKITKATEYYGYIDDKDAVAEQYAKLGAYIEQYREKAEEVNAEYDVTEEIEKKYFMTILQIVNYMTIAAYLLLKGKRWFL